MHIYFTKEELTSVLGQLESSIEELEKEQVKAGTEGRIPRVLEIEAIRGPLVKAKEKMLEELKREDN